MQVVLDRRRAPENYEFQYRQNNNNSYNFRQFRSIKKTLLNERNIKNFSSKTLLQIKSYQLLILLKKSSQNLRSKQNLTIGICRKIYQFLAFVDYEDFDSKINIHYFSNEESSLSKEVSLEPLTEKFKLVLVKNYDF